MTSCNRPKAAPPYFPYTTHRTMADVLFDEKMDRFWRRPQPEKKLTLPDWEALQEAAE